MLYKTALSQKVNKIKAPRVSCFAWRLAYSTTGIYEKYPPSPARRSVGDGEVGAVEKTFSRFE